MKTNTVRSLLWKAKQGRSRGTQRSNKQLLGRELYTKGDPNKWTNIRFWYWDYLIKFSAVLSGWQYGRAGPLSHNALDLAVAAPLYWFLSPQSHMFPMYGRSRAQNHNAFNTYFRLVLFMKVIKLIVFLWINPVCSLRASMILHLTHTLHLNIELQFWNLVYYIK